MRAARAEVDLDAIAENVRALGRLAGDATLCAVVKADGYGHGAIAVSRAALDAGASWLAVALVEEGAVLRKAGIEAPVLLLSEPRIADLDAAVHWDLRLALYTEAAIDAAERAAAAEGRTVRVHLKVDTGMHRVGAPPESAVALARRVADCPHLELEGLWTHCAVADEPDNPYTPGQLDRFDAVVDALAGVGLQPPVRHAANSAATIAHPRSHHELVRCGIAVYGIDPDPALAGSVPLRPALRLVAEVAHVKRLPAGRRLSYGLRYELSDDAWVATVPIGYADGVPRRLGLTGGEVLVGGRRRPIAGVVTMDQLLVDCGEHRPAPGDEVVLLGTQGAERIDPQEWADRLDTIAYEIVCGIGPRVPRRYRGAGLPDLPDPLLVDDA